jgi:hypothetical protein
MMATLLNSGTVGLGEADSVEVGETDSIGLGDVEEVAETDITETLLLAELDANISFWAES